MSNPFLADDPMNGADSLVLTPQKTLRESISNAALSPPPFIDSIDKSMSISVETTPTSSVPSSSRLPVSHPRIDIINAGELVSADDNGIHGQELIFNPDLECEQDSVVAPMASKLTVSQSTPSGISPAQNVSATRRPTRPVLPHSAQHTPLKHPSVRPPTPTFSRTTTTATAGPKVAAIPHKQPMNTSAPQRSRPMHPSTPATRPASRASSPMPTPAPRRTSPAPARLPARSHTSVRADTRAGTPTSASVAATRTPARPVSSARTRTPPATATPPHTTHNMRARPPTPTNRPSTPTRAGPPASTPISTPARLRQPSATRTAAILAATPVRPQSAASRTIASAPVSAPQALPSPADAVTPTLLVHRGGAGTMRPALPLALGPCTLAALRAGTASVADAEAEAAPELCISGRASAAPVVSVSVDVHYPVDGTRTAPVPVGDGGVAAADGCDEEDKVDGEGGVAGLSTGAPSAHTLPHSDDAETDLDSDIDSDADDLVDAASAACEAATQLPAAVTLPASALPLAGAFAMHGPDEQACALADADADWTRSYGQGRQGASGASEDCWLLSPTPMPGATHADATADADSVLSLFPCAPAQTEAASAAADADEDAADAARQWEGGWGSALSAAQSQEALGQLVEFAAQHGVLFMDPVPDVRPDAAMSPRGCSPAESADASDVSDSSLPGSLGEYQLPRDHSLSPPRSSNAPLSAVRLSTAELLLAAETRLRRLQTALVVDNRDTHSSATRGQDVCEGLSVSNCELARAPPRASALVAAYECVEGGDAKATAGRVGRSRVRERVVDVLDVWEESVVTVPFHMHAAAQAGQVFLQEVLTPAQTHARAHAEADTGVFSSMEKPEWVGASEHTVVKRDSTNVSLVLPSRALTNASNTHNTVHAPSASPAPAHSTRPRTSPAVSVALAVPVVEHVTTDRWGTPAHPPPPATPAPATPARPCLASPTKTLPTRATPIRPHTPAARAPSAPRTPSRAASRHPAAVPIAPASSAPIGGAPGTLRCRAFRKLRIGWARVPESVHGNSPSATDLAAEAADASVAPVWASTDWRTVANAALVAQLQFYRNLPQSQAYARTQRRLDAALAENAALQGRISNLELRAERAERALAEMVRATDGCVASSAAQDDLSDAELAVLADTAPPAPALTPTSPSASSPPAAKPVSLPPSPASAASHSPTRALNIEDFLPHTARAKSSSPLASPTSAARGTQKQPPTPAAATANGAPIRGGTPFAVPTRAAPVQGEAATTLLPTPLSTSPAPSTRAAAHKPPPSPAPAAARDRAAVLRLQKLSTLASDERATLAAALLALRARFKKLWSQHQALARSFALQSSELTYVQTSSAKSKAEATGAARRVAATAASLYARIRGCALALQQASEVCAWAGRISTRYASTVLQRQAQLAREAREAICATVEYVTAVRKGSEGVGALVVASAERIDRFETQRAEVEALWRRRCCNSSTNALTPTISSTTTLPSSSTAMAAGVPARGLGSLARVRSLAHHYSLAVEKAKEPAMPEAAATSDATDSDVEAVTADKPSQQSLRLPASADAEFHRLTCSLESLASSTSTAAESLLRTGQSLDAVVDECSLACEQVRVCHEVSQEVLDAAGRDATAAAREAARLYRAVRAWHQ